MDSKPKSQTRKRSLKEGPVIYQPEDYLIDEHKIKKNLTLSELNHVFKMYLKENGISRKDISILGQFSLVFNDPRLSTWHAMSKSEQSHALSELVIMPELYDELITTLGALAGDADTIKRIVKDAYQNAIDSFSHAAFIQKKYARRFPGIKIILFVDQIRELVILAVVDNGFGEKIAKPKISYTGQEYGDDFISRFADWLVRRYVEEDDSNIRRDIAYTGGQGMGLKKIKIELGLNVDVHFFVSGAVFDVRLKNYF